MPSGVRKDPQASLVADKADSNRDFFLSGDNKAVTEFTGRHKLVLLLFLLTFVVMIWGVSAGGWWMARNVGPAAGWPVLSLACLTVCPRAELAETFVSSSSDFPGCGLCHCPCPRHSGGHGCRSYYRHNTVLGGKRRDRLVRGRFRQCHVLDTGGAVLLYSPPLRVLRS